MMKNSTIRPDNLEKSMSYHIESEQGIGSNGPLRIIRNGAVKADSSILQSGRANSQNYQHGISNQMKEVKLRLSGATGTVKDIKDQQL
jgi:hypothetical protein